MVHKLLYHCVWSDQAIGDMGLAKKLRLLSFCDNRPVFRPLEVR